MCPEGIIDPEGMISALDCQYVAVEFCRAAFVKLNRIGEGLVDRENLFLDVLIAGVGMRGLEGSIGGEICSLLAVYDQVVQEVFQRASRLAILASREAEIVLNVLYDGQHGVEGLLRNVVETFILNGWVAIIEDDGQELLHVVVPLDVMSLHGSDLEAAALIDQELKHIIDESDFVDHHVSVSHPAPVHLRESLA